MTRHRDELAVFVDRSSLHSEDVAVNVGRRGLVDPEQPVDDRSDAEIVAAIDKSMQRVTAPRNALDVLGLPPALSMPATSASPVPKLLAPSEAGGGRRCWKWPAPSGSNRCNETRPKKRQQWGGGLPLSGRKKHYSS